MQGTSESYILTDLYFAPEYHLAKNTYKELPAIEPDVLKSEYEDRGNGNRGKFFMSQLEHLVYYLKEQLQGITFF
ncbi:MAG: hypothetical protein JO235_13345 [Chroococcidiopsidaceae cyanobacterium CP_BM_RX_35]|nr:hypothetical protein [Chroococcidiopsidaceae cyanobacterium CP_BM_RX_35]